MLNSVKVFFEKYIKPSPEDPDSISEHSLQIATAALLIEMSRANQEVTDEERRSVSDLIRTRFDLSREETKALVDLAKEEIWKSTGYYDFTSLMNKGFSYDEKIRVVEYLWEIALADKNIDAHEEYMVRKIAHLIHVSHRDFIDAKLRVRSRKQS